MAKRVICIVITLLFLISLNGCVSTEYELSSTEAKLVLDGESILTDTPASVSLKFHTAEIPVLAILEAAGAEIERAPVGQEDAERITVTVNGGTFSFDTSKGNLGVDAPPWLLSATSPYSGKLIRRVDGEELVLDSRSVSAIFYHIFGMDIRVSYVDSTIYIDSLDPSELTYSDAELEKTNCRLIVNGKDITEGNYVYIDEEKELAEIPMIAVAKELGYEIQWLPCEPYPLKDRCIIRLMLDGYAFDFDTSKANFAIYQCDFALTHPNGTSPINGQLLGNEMVVESTSVQWVFRDWMNAHIRIDFENPTVYIDEKTT